MTTVIFSDTRILSDQIYFILAFAQSFGYNGLLLFAFLLTANRLMVFAFPKIGNFFFDRPRILVTIFVVWILTAVLVTGIMLSPCPIIAKPEDLGFGSGCIGGEANMFNYIGQYVATYGPIVMIVAYILIYIEIKIGIFGNGFCCYFGNLFRKNQNQAHNLAEIKLLLQAAMICSTFFIQNFCWTYLPFITASMSNGEEFIFIAIMLSSILLYSVDAIVVLIFNGTIRRVAISFFKEDNNRVFVSQMKSSIITISAEQTRRTSIWPNVK
uniref:7TM GPCR serpentine receptor class x (Srx) domain-containing protein n=1 Tax=Panagrolaimus davidi TaxID=227884 RepID=A0A914R304_9BILA